MQQCCRQLSTSLCDDFQVSGRVVSVLSQPPHLHPLPLFYSAVFLFCIPLPAAAVKFMILSSKIS